MTKTKEIGEYTVTLDKLDGLKIAIVGEYGSNYGVIYEHLVEAFNSHPEGAEFEWNRPQVIGMEWDYGMVPAVKNWIYSEISNLAY